MVASEPFLLLCANGRLAVQDIVLCNAFAYRRLKVFFTHVAIGVFFLVTHTSIVNAQSSVGGPTLNGINPALISPTGTLGTLGAGNQNNDADTDIIVDDQGVDDVQTGAVAATNSNLVLPASGRIIPEVSQGRIQQRVTSTQPAQGDGGRTSDLTPFDPLGVRIGKFILRPSLEVNSGYTSNSTNDVTGSGSTFVNIVPSFNVESDFARHALALQAQGVLDRFARGDDTSDLDITVNASGRYDIDGDSSVTAALDIAVQEDDQTGIADDPLEKTVTASLQLEHVLGQFDTQSQVRVSRNVNDSFVDAAGVVQSQDDLDSTLVGGNARVTFRSGRVFEPFVEVDVSREIFDESTDVLGNQRNVTGLRGLFGVEVDRGEKLNGEIAVGFGESLIDGDDIDDFGSFLAEFNLTWSPQRLTNVVLTGTTTLDAFPSIATPGDTTYDFNVTVSHDLRENLTAIAGGGVNWQVDGGDNGTDTTIAANVGLGYQLGRYIGLELDYAFARQFTPSGIADFTSNTISVGIRAER